ncbi:hypothetical protein [Photobacterium angustum]|uniref:Uncharacterized protein n=2 Tax=Photobacterium angustum TaxID=661 RepID=A0A855SKN9_PHOAN|nr:hypothetical protein [Photobacterium angustum]KJF80969.1 hypothetical protein UB36_15105 [Photobacterium damselae subsp. damselae]KJG38830.1 hypothetical protein UA35_15065 [Photobacterium angustum]KJG44436.1 hypothetical protein UA31_15110 [Photobacterium angustum]KJG50460.1 hypothetical protein UA30_00525 [Photobacterium angustum]KJG54332.1 hypothetical protein UA34_00535 [Photobacterium angustum]
MTTDYVSIDVPFEFRHTCWFCGEPYYESHAFMAKPNYDGQSSPIMVPCCQECFGFTKEIKVSSLDLLRDKVKEKLHKKYQKHLQIGVNWTKQELEECEFEGKALEGFRESGWAMFEIAKGRVNYRGWAVSIDGIPVEGLTTAFQFEFDGIVYTSLNHAVIQLATAYAIPQPYLEQVVELVGRDKMAYALRFCKTSYGYSSAEIAASLASLRALLAEEKANKQIENSNNRRRKNTKVAISEIKELILHRTMISPYAIQWALEHGATTLQLLAEQEEAFFEHFNKESELTAFTYFNGLQIYLEQREIDPEWVVNSDPNKQLFES